MAGSRMDTEVQLRDRGRSRFGVQCGQNPARVVAQFGRPGGIVDNDSQPASFEPFGLRVHRDGLADGLGPALVEVDRAAPRTETGSNRLERIADRPRLAATCCATAFLHPEITSPVLDLDLAVGFDSGGNVTSGRGDHSLRGR